MTETPIRRSRRLLRLAAGVRAGGVAGRLAGRDDDQRAQREAHRIRHRGVGTRPEGPSAGPTVDQRRQGGVGTGVHRPTATCCSSRCARPRTTTSRPRRCGACLRPAARPSRFLHRPAASKPSGRRAAAPQSRGACTVAAVGGTASTTTVGCGICARTTRSPRSCTPAIRSGTGTRISAPPHRICSMDDGDGATPADLTPQPGGALRDADFDVSADGSFVVTSWQRPAPDASQHSVLVRIDVALRRAHRHRRRAGCRSVEPGHLAGRVGGGIHPRVVLDAGRVHRESA